MTDLQILFIGAVAVAAAWAYLVLCDRVRG
jgi:hypothetical protein